MFPYVVAMFNNVFFSMQDRHTVSDQYDGAKSKILANPNIWLRLGALSWILFKLLHKTIDGTSCS